MTRSITSCPQGIASVAWRSAPLPWSSYLQGFTPVIASVARRSAPLPCSSFLQGFTPVIASFAKRSAFSNLKSKLQIATSLRSYSVRKQSQRRVLPSHRARRVSRAAFAKQSLAKKNGRAKCGDLVVKSLARPVPETKWMGIRTPARSYISLGLPTSAYSADELRKTSENGDST